MSLPQLVATIKALIVKADQAGDKYEQFAIATGKHLADAKLRLQAKNKSIRSHKKAERTEQPQTWEDFVKEHFNFNQQRADLYIAISDGRKSVAKLRAEKTEQKRVERKRKVTATSRSKSTSDEAAYAGMRDLAVEHGYTLRRLGKGYQLTGGKDDIDMRPDDLVAVEAHLNMITGKQFFEIGDECATHPLSMTTNNAEAVEAYTAARKGNLHKRGGLVFEFCNACDAYLPRMNADELAKVRQYFLEAVDRISARAAAA